MSRTTLSLAFAAVVLTRFVCAAEERWTILVTNDNCPDYTWGLTEAQTRQAFADVVKGHLDEMNRTDNEAHEHRDRYNMAVTQEALCFVERYPERKDELIRRLKQGRVYMSPYLCNTLWGWQSAEGILRAFYPAQRLAREWDIAIREAHHIEEPSLPWGVATLLAGCDYRALSVPYLNYDTAFDGLKNPPLFFHEGPDGSRTLVWLDRWSSSKWNYTQGAALLRKPELIKGEWIPRHIALGDAYPLRAILASGTHGDISPQSGNQAAEFSRLLREYNRRADRAADLVNATFPRFWEEAFGETPEQMYAIGPSGSFAGATARLPRPDSGRRAPSLPPSCYPVLRGCLGHSWDLWPVSLAKYAADAREGERRFLAAETLAAVAGLRDRGLSAATRTDRERAEWCWAMLADHAWNGTDVQNKRHNADLRRRWSEELIRRAGELERRAWVAGGMVPDADIVTVFNSLSAPRSVLLRLSNGKTVAAFADGGGLLPAQTVEENGTKANYCVVPDVPGFGSRQVRVAVKPAAGPEAASLTATATALENTWYRLAVDPKTGGIASLIHKPSGQEALAVPSRRSLCQTVYFSGQEQTLTDIQTDVVAVGPVLARLRICGKTPGLQVTNFVTVYAALDRVDFDVRLKKTPTDKEERLCQMFPIVRPGATLRAASAGAVVRLRRQPEGDLLPGADTRRFAVQEFCHASDGKLSVTVVPWDAFALRLDFDTLAFEAVGNDQNHREVLHDQNGVTEFRFRYSLRATAGDYRGPEVIAFSRDAVTEPMVLAGRRAGGGEPPVTVDPGRAVATCFKPADASPDAGCILRVWEAAGQSGPLHVDVRGFGKAIETDLLERNGKPLPIVDGRIQLPLRANGYSAVRLVAR